MWAFPEKDEHVKAIYNELKTSFDKPKNLQTFIDASFSKSADYVHDQHKLAMDRMQARNA